MIHIWNPPGSPTKELKFPEVSAFFFRTIQEISGIFRKKSRDYLICLEGSNEKIQLFIKNVQLFIEKLQFSLKICDFSMENVPELLSATDFSMENVPELLSATLEYLQGTTPWTSQIRPAGQIHPPGHLGRYNSLDHISARQHRHTDIPKLRQ